MAGLMEAIILLHGELIMHRIFLPVRCFDTDGFVEELPRLPENRIGHVCAALPAMGVQTL